MIRDYFKALNNRGVVLAFFVVILILSLILSYALVRLKNEAIESNKKIVLLLNRTYEDHLSNTFDSVELALKNISYRFSLSHTKEEMDSYIYSVLFDAPFLKSISIASENGQIFYSSNNNNMDKIVDLDSFYPSAFGDAKILRFSNLFRGRDIGSEDLELSYFCASLDFEIEGRRYTVVSTLNPPFFLDYYYQNRDSKTTDTRVLNLFGGEIISTSEEKLISKSDVLDLAYKNLFGADIFGAKEIRELISYRSSKRYPFVVVVSKKYDLMLKEWRDERDMIIVITFFTFAIFLALILPLYGRYKLQREHIQKESELEKRRMKGLIDSVPDALILLDIDGKIMMSNSKWREFLDRYFLNLFTKNRDFLEIFKLVIKESKDSNKLLNSIDSVIKREKNFEFFEYSLNNEGELKHYNLHIQNIDEPKLVGSIITQIDTTQKYQAELELEKTLEELNSRVDSAIKKTEEQDMVIYEQRRHQALSNLIINIAHQWRQPINVIALSLIILEDNLLERDENKNSDLDSAIESIRKELSYLSEIINYFSDIYNPKLEEIESIDISSLFQEIVKLFEIRFKSSKIDVTINIEKNLLIEASKIDLIEIFAQLIENIFNIKSQREIDRAEVVISAKYNNEFVDIEMADSVGGIEPLMLEHIFDPYSTSSFKSRQKGLGLYQIRRLLERKYQAHISISNNSIGGASVRVRFFMKGKSI